MLFRSHALTLPQITARLNAYGVNAERRTLYKDIEFLEKKTDGQPTKNESDEFMKIPEGIENEIPFG